MLVKGDTRSFDYSSGHAGFRVGKMGSLKALKFDKPPVFLVLVGLVANPTMLVLNALQPL